MREPTKMGRPREFDENEALAAIMDVFWTKGFDVGPGCATTHRLDRDQT